MTARLQGRTALVTGSTDGIGAGIARALADEGAFVVVSGRSAAKGEKVVAEIAERGGAAAFVGADLAGGPRPPASWPTPPRPRPARRSTSSSTTPRCSSRPGRRPRSARS